jgi:hypothetical protein
MDIWFLKNVLLINKKLKETIVVHMVTVNLLLKFKNLTSLEEDGEIHQKRK